MIGVPALATPAGWVPAAAAGTVTRTRATSAALAFRSWQVRLARVTDAAGGAPLAASANVSAFTVGNALGAWLGGRTISAGPGYTAPLHAGAAVVLLGLVVMVIAAASATTRSRS